MNIIIDGYNLLKQVSRKKTIAPHERARFHARAVDYAKKKRHTLYIIYDGGSDPRPVIEKKGAVITVYSGYKQTADDVIKSYIDERILKDMLVVTTDRQLNAYAESYQVPSIDALDFYSLMQDRKIPTLGYKKVAGTAHKLHEEEGSAELDALMQEGASVLLYKEEESEEKNKTKKASKVERLTHALLRKL